MHIHELHLHTHTIAAQQRFYADTLGLPMRAASSGELALDAGTTVLHFAPAAPGEQPRYHIAFNVPPQQFAEAKAWLSARVPLLADRSGADEFPFDNWDAHALYFYDPAGNILELIARSDLPSESSEPFSASSLLCVSEIGLVTDDVPATTRMLQEQPGITVYRDSVSDMFTALGDAHGLFIIVQRGREWFPDTSQAAVLAPLRAIVSAAADGLRHSIHGPPFSVDQ